MFRLYCVELILLHNNDNDCLVVNAKSQKDTDLQTTPFLWRYNQRITQEINKIFSYCELNYKLKNYLLSLRQHWSFDFVPHSKTFVLKIAIFSINESQFRPVRPHSFKYLLIFTKCKLYAQVRIHTTVHECFSII